ncbi:hypothetical protein BJ165DRAFT_1015679 [Panaeolus papilionaceus]|nr:hypothetical protein BJ165DRAFT_1015679 [Panaeolus papilionaceus]
MHANEIYAALSEIHTPGEYHWSFFVVAQDPAFAGWRVHATNHETDDWHFESVSWSGPHAPDSLVFVKIGEILDGLDVRHLVEYVKDIPMAVPPDRQPFEPEFNSRVWFREAIRTLHEAQMFVCCFDVEKLIEELAMKGTVAQYRGPGLHRPTFFVARHAKPWNNYD